MHDLYRPDQTSRSRQRFSALALHLLQHARIDCWSYLARHSKPQASSMYSLVSCDIPDLWLGDAVTCNGSPSATRKRSRNSSSPSSTTIISSWCFMYSPNIMCPCQETWDVTHMSCVQDGGYWRIEFWFDCPTGNWLLRHHTQHPQLSR